MKAPGECSHTVTKPTTATAVQKLTRSAAEAPPSQENSSSDLRSKATTSRSTSTPGPRGVLFEFDTNSNAPAGKAFHDTPYPKQASKKVRVRISPNQSPL